MTRHRRFPRLLAALVLGGGLVLSACSSSGGTEFHFATKTDPGGLISESNRKPAQKLDGTLISSGDKINLTVAKGQVTLLNFWASWCGPCKVETPQLDSLYRQMKSKGVRFIGVDDRDEKSAAKSFISSNDITYPIVFDQRGQIQLALGNIPGSLPFTVLIDKQGRVAAVYVAKLAPKDLQGPLTTLLAER